MILFYIILITTNRSEKAMYQVDMCIYIYKKSGIIHVGAQMDRTRCMVHIIYLKDERTTSSRSRSIVHIVT